MTTSVACRTLLAALLVAAGAGGAWGNEPLYVLDGEAIYRVVPGREDIKVADGIGPGIPTAIQAPTPDYPAELDRAWVLEVEAVIGQDGMVEEATIIGSRPFPEAATGWAAPPWIPELQASAVAAFEEREYRPVVLDGNPIRLRISVALVYSPPTPPAARDDTDRARGQERTGTGGPRVR